MTTALRSLRLNAAAAAEAVVDAEARQITGLLVPFGPVGYASLGAVTFARGSIRLPAQLGRVKLLRDHDTAQPLGYAASIEETDEGLRGAFEVAPGPDGDLALAERTDGRRDGLSVGVQLDEECMSQLVEQWLTGDTTPVPCTGELVEVSQVALPAFADARTDGSHALAANLAGDVTLALSFGATPAPPAAPAAGNREDTHPMFTAAQLAALRAAGIDPTDLAASNAHLASLAPVATPPAAPAPPAAPPIAAGASGVEVVSEPPVYTFDGRGPSLIRDAYRLRFEQNTEAAQRFHAFNQRLVAADPAQARLLVAAVETRATAPNYVNQGYRPELLVEAIDRGRPLISRIGTVPLTDATPFRVPVEASDLYKGTTVADGATTAGSATVTSATAAFTAADLGMPISNANIPAGSLIVKINSATSVNLSQKATATGTGLTFVIQRNAVGDHTEGTSHVAEGDLDVGEALFSPTAVSGAYRLSRELIDATNPAIDRIALRAMGRDYAKQTERKVAAAFEAAAPSPASGTNTVVKLRQAASTFFDVTDEAPTFIASSIGYFNTLLGDVDGANRPQLPSVGPMNAAGTLRPGFTGAYIDTAELFKSTRITGDAAYIFNPDDVLVGESSTQLFRFEEVEGPGVVKLALWGYFGAKVLRQISVQAVSV